MAKHTFYDWYKEQPPVGRAVFGIAAVLVTVGVVYATWQAIAQYKKDKANLQESKDSVDALNQLSKKGVTVSVSDAQFESWSNILATAFSGCGTDTQSVYNVFGQLKNDADLYKLIAVYGVRSYDACLWGTKSWSLSAAISDELDASEKAKLNGILYDLGINYKFA